MSDKKVYIIAEAGVNHNGCLAKALHLCDLAKDAGADAVKFQTFNTEKIVCRHAELADYQKRNIGSNTGQYSMLKKLELRDNEFRKIKKHCDKIGIEFLSTPDDEGSLELLLDIGMDKIKIGSGAITHIPFLKRIAQSRKPVILSTGMATMKEIRLAYHVLCNYGAKRVALLHCTSSYPCPMSDVNLRVIPYLQKIFKTEVGYSDHTLGIEISIAAAALGATIIEKHITLDRKLPGPDHKASLEGKEFKAMVCAIRNIEKALGCNKKVPAPSESKNIKIVRRSIVAGRNIIKGEIFTQENLAVKIPGQGISPGRWNKIIGMVAKKDFVKDEYIRI